MNASRAHIFQLAEKVFVGAVLLLSTGIALSSQLDPNAGGASESNPVQQAINLVNYAAVASLLALRANRAAIVASRDPLLWILLLLACLSGIWSATPAVTLRRSGALLGTTAVGVYLAMRFSIAEQVRLLAKVLLLTAVLSLAVIVLWPERGIYGNELGAEGIFFRGLYANKNAFGQAMALGALTMLFAFFNSSHRWLWCFGFFLCVGLLALTRSATATVVLMVTVAMLPVLGLLRRNYRLTLLLIGGTVGPCSVMIAWLWANADSVFGILGKNLTLTGRTDIWAAVMDMIWQRPWLGYGLNGFWLGWEGPSAYVCQIAGWAVPHAHNGFLDLWLALGVWGLMIFVAEFAIAFFRALTAMVRSTYAFEGFWPVIYLTFMLLYNMTESVILRPHSIFWMLYVAAVCLRPKPAARTAPDESPGVSL